MAIDSGIGQFLDWGTSTTVSTSVGKVTSGTWNGDSAAVHEEGIMAQDKIVGGPIPIGGSCSLQLANHDLTAYALRSNFTAPTLTDLCFAGTFNGDGRKQTGCKLNTLRLSCSPGAALVADLAWLGLTDEAYSTAAKAAISDVVFRWHTAVVTIGGASLQCVGFDLTLNNNCEHVYTLDAATTNQQRWPDAIHVGSQEVTLSVDVLTRPTTTAWADILGDTLATNGAAVMTFTGGTGGTETLTITLTNLSRFTQPVPLQAGGGLITYALTFEGRKDASGVITITCA